MSINLFYVLIVLLLLNLRTYFLMIQDKRIAIKNGESTNNSKRRTPEKYLLTNAALLGFAGIFLGMLPPVNHKGNKPKFKWGVPTIALVEIALMYYLYQALLPTINFYYNAPF